MALTSEQLAALGIDGPAETGEFLPAVRGGPQTDTKPNLRLVLQDSEKATAPKIRHLVNELLAGNLQNADIALKQLFQANPKAGLELFVELSKFSLPQLKAVAVAVDDKSDKPQTLSYAQLTQLLASDD